MLARGVPGSILLVSVLLTTPCTLQAEPINLYQYVLGIDVPESPGVMLLALGGSPVVRGSAPKPTTLTMLLSGESERLVPSLAIDVAPYYLFGGGIRDLQGYRSNSVAGRLTRVLTKTTLTIAASGAPESGGPQGLAFGIRATLHDPHDPVLNSAFPESVAALLARSGTPNTAGDVEDITDLGADIAPVFAVSRRAMRARRGMQISAGFGQAYEMRGSSVSSDSLDAGLRVIWLTSQITFSARFDALVTGQVRDRSGEDARLWLALGILRKMNATDIQLALYYDSDSRRIYPFLQTEIRALPHFQVFGTCTVFQRSEEASSVFSARAGFRWFLAHDS